MKKAVLAAAALSCLGLGALTLPTQAHPILKSGTIIDLPDGSIVEVTEIVRDGDSCRVVRYFKSGNETVICED
jgi:hypothetical protein